MSYRRYHFYEKFLVNMGHTPEVLKRNKTYVVILIFISFLILYFSTTIKDLNIVTSKLTSIQSEETIVKEILIRSIKTQPTPAKNHISKSVLKTILYWDNFFGDRRMEFGAGKDIFKNCTYSNCFATENHTYIPTENFDAIMYHSACYNNLSHGAPKIRSPHQKYIFFSLESPYVTNFDNTLYKGFYNWTMTYRRDSDIFYPYGVIQEKETNYKLPDPATIQTRPKLIAWFVSNCYMECTKRRMAYVKELSKYIPVDIYGKCGNLTCKKNTNCYQMLETNYKFYLSFENSMCADYVTEKLFYVLNYNVVPIVLGNADYSTLAPPHSVINTKDFLNPKALAHYILHLNASVDEYLPYFEWKKKYVVVDREPFKQNVLCQLCELLHRPLHYYKYENIKEWYFGHYCYL